MRFSRFLRVGPLAAYEFRPATVSGLPGGYFFAGAGSPVRISPWHDIPLAASPVTLPGDSAQLPVFHFINEIPMGTTKKMEISPKLEANPMVQDTKNGKPREFKYGTIPFNYGVLPQTWEDPSTPDSRSKLMGDNDPLDVVEMTPSPLPMGAVYKVIVVGALGLIDQGEMDWKILVRRVSEAERFCTGTSTSASVASLVGTRPCLDGEVPLKTIVDWFENYKVAEGKAKNKFLNDGRLLEADEAVSVIRETATHYGKLMSGDTPNPKLWLRS